VVTTEPPEAGLSDPGRGRGVNTGQADRRTEFRRGWRSLVAATLGTGVGVTVISTYTSGLVVNAFGAEFGWTRSQLSSLQLVGSVALIMTAPVVGWMVDRWGVRWPGGIALAALGAGYLLLSTSGSTFLIYATLYTVVVVLASPSTPVSFTRAVNERFDRARGVALGISLTFAGVVVFLIPAVLGTVLASDWRTGYRLLGGAIVGCAVVVVLLMPRSSAGSRTSTEEQPAQQTTRNGILPFVRRPLFLRLSATYLVLTLGIGWIPLLLVALLRDGGVSAGAAAQTASLIGLTLIGARFGVGMLVDRFFAPRVGALLLVAAAAGLVALWLGGPAFGAAAAVSVGLALGAEVDLLGNLTSRYYPAALYGRLFGLFYAVMVLGLGVSPVLITALRDATGSYSLPIAASAGLILLAAVSLATAPRFDTEAVVHG